MSTQDTAVDIQSTEYDPSDILPAGDLPHDAEFKHLYTSKQWAYAMRKRDDSGLSDAIIILGDRRLFILRSKFRQWLASRIETQS